VVYQLCPEVNLNAAMLKQKMQELKVLSKLRDVVWRWSKSGLIEVLSDGSIRKAPQTPQAS
jgi:hypothetical protein